MGNKEGRITMIDVSVMCDDFLVNWRRSDSRRGRRGWRWRGGSSFPLGDSSSYALDLWR